MEAEGSLVPRRAPGLAPWDRQPTLVYWLVLYGCSQNEEPAPKCLDTPHWCRATRAQRLGVDLRPERGREEGAWQLSFLQAVPLEQISEVILLVLALTV